MSDTPHVRFATTPRSTPILRHAARPDSRRFPTPSGGKIVTHREHPGISAAFPSVATGLSELVNSTRPD